MTNGHKSCSISSRLMIFLVSAGGGTYDRARSDTPSEMARSFRFEKWIRSEVLPQSTAIQGCQAFYVIREYGERTITVFQVFRMERDLDNDKASQRYRGWVETSRRQFLHQTSLIQETLFQGLDQQHGFFPGSPSGGHETTATPH